MADSMLYLDSYGRNGFKVVQTKNRYDICIDTINFEVEGNDDSIKLLYKGLAKDNIQNKIDIIVGPLMKWCEEHPKEEYLQKELVEAMKEKKHGRNNTIKACDFLASKEVKFFTKKTKKGTYKKEVKNEPEFTI